MQHASNNNNNNGNNTNNKTHHNTNHALYTILGITILRSYIDNNIYYSRGRLLRLRDELEAGQRVHLSGADGSLSLSLSLSL